MGRKSNGKTKETSTASTPTLDPGDIICLKCEGLGWLTKDLSRENDWQYTCDKCWGAGKLDWIERIMGKPSPHHTLKGDWSIEMDQELNALHDISLDSEIIDAMTQEIADEIDEEIIKNIIEFSVTQSKLK